MNETLLKVGSRLRSFRKEVGYTQEQVAENSGVSPAYFTVEWLLAVAETLQVTVPEIWDIEPELEREDLLLELNDLFTYCSDEQLKKVYRLIREII